MHEWTEKSSDEALMEAYKAGEAQAFEWLFERYANRIRSFLRRRLGRESSLHEDLFQITWLKVHQARESFDPSKRFSPWIFQIALNSVRDYGRQKTKRSEIEFQEAFMSDGNGDEEEAHLIKEELDQLNQFLEKFSAQHRELLILSDWEGFSADEISEMTQMSSDAVRQSLSRSRRKLRQWRDQK